MCVCVDFVCVCVCVDLCVSDIVYFVHDWQLSAPPPNVSNVHTITHAYTPSPTHTHHHPPFHTTSPPHPPPHTQHTIQCCRVAMVPTHKHPTLERHRSHQICWWCLVGLCKRDSVCFEVLPLCSSRSPPGDEVFLYCIDELGVVEVWVGTNG